jgi:multicomponent Na+:H+ antiporter subunit E
MESYAGTIIAVTYYTAKGAVMGRHTIFVTMALTLVWVILMEGISWQILAIGLFTGVTAGHFMGKFFGFEEIRDVNFFKLATYPVWLILRIYTDAIFLVRQIFRGSKWGVMRADMNLKSPTLRTIMADSITLTPGSVYLMMEKDVIHLLCIDAYDKKGYPAALDDLRSIEKQLGKAYVAPEGGEEVLE